MSCPSCPVCTIPQFLTPTQNALCSKLQVCILYTVAYVSCALQADTARALDASVRGGLGAGVSPLAASALQSDLLLQWCARNRTDTALSPVRTDHCSSVRSLYPFHKLCISYFQYKALP